MDNVSNIDFSEHELIITEQEGLLIHHLRIPGKYMNNIKYINTNDIMAVTGDFGNWVFSREFHPGSTDGVSRGYWDGKLIYSSSQKPYDYDPDETENEIKKLIEEEKDLSEEELEYLTECLSRVDDKLDYEYFAYRENIGRFVDYEFVPYAQKRKIWLEIVYDGFNEICKRIK